MMHKLGLCTFYMLLSQDSNNTERQCLFSAEKLFICQDLMYPSHVHWLLMLEKLTLKDAMARLPFSHIHYNPTPFQVHSSY